MLKSAGADIIAAKLKKAPNGLSSNDGTTYGMSKSQFESGLAEHRDTVVDRDADYMAEQIAKGVVVTDPNVPSAIIISEQIIAPSGARKWVHKMASRQTYLRYRRRRMRQQLTMVRRDEAAALAAWNRWNIPMDYQWYYGLNQQRVALEHQLATMP